MSEPARGTVLSGWVHEVLPDRSEFVVRNRAGLTRVRLGTGTARRHGRWLRLEDVVRVEVAAGRGPGPDGILECAEVEVLNTNTGIPFTATTRESAPGSARSRYRYLEFRDPAVARLLEARHQFVRRLCTYLDEDGFVAVETPLLTHPSGSGAREFSVRSALRPEVPYVLPQSPQVYGQLVAAGGLERYYQLARCFRDEDLRADRQPEFTQLQVELAFADRDEVVALLEAALGDACAALGVELSTPVPRLSHAQCLRMYGTDKPDLRLAPEPRLLPYRITDSTAGVGGDIVATALPAGVGLDPSWWEGIARAAAVRGWELAGFLDESQRRAYSPPELAMRDLRPALHLAPGWAPDLIPVWRGGWHHVHRLVKLVYRSLVRDAQPPNTLAFAWVLDFPLFEVDPATGALAAANHPFCAPKDAGAFDRARTREELLALVSTSFDLVLNGEELGSGSVVNHRSEIQQRILDLLALPRAERGRFKFILESMRFGAPPVAGFGLGIDRTVAMLSGRPGIREVMAFPKTKQGFCPVTSRR
jgi:aspartyl-tRNA synthetase